jgi:ribose transport system permease protein
LIGALVAMIIFSAILSPNFLKAENILNLLQNSAFIGIVALGMTLVIISGGIDLSVGAVVAFAGTLGVWTMNTSLQAGAIISGAEDARRYHMPASDSALRITLARLLTSMHLTSEMAAVLLAIVTILIVATLAGAFNGLLIAKGRLAPFIATLATMAMFRSLALSIADGGEVRSASESFFRRFGAGGIPLFGREVAKGVPLIFPYPAMLFIALAIFAHILLNRTRYGRYLFAIGCNERSAIYSAINVDRIKWLTYTVAGILSGIAGLLLASRFNSVNSSSTGDLFELDAIAAVVIGGTRMQGGSGTIWGTVVGVLILAIISNMLGLLDVNPYLQGFVKGVIIIAAVVVQRTGRGSN